MKNCLDRKTTGIFNNKSTNNQNSKLMSQIKRSSKKVEEFNKKAPSCPNFTFKEKEGQIKVYWCKEIDSRCCYKFCPKIKK